MNSRYDLIVFDWEGTLGDTFGKVLNRLIEEAKNLGLGEVEESMARQYLTSGLIVAIKKLFPNAPSHQLNSLLQIVQESAASRSVETYLLPGASHILDSIKQAGIALAIATNKGLPSLQRDLHAANLDTYFDTVRCAGQCPAKPCPQMLEDIMNTCNISTDKTLMVGDSVSDIQMAQAAGVDVIGVNFYHQPEQAQELLAAGAMMVIDDFQQLADFLNIEP